MTDKLGNGGHAHEHSETIAVASEGANEARRANWIATLALIASAAGLLVAGLTYSATVGALKQNRESLLLHDRIETCVALVSAAGDFDRQIFEFLRQSERSMTESEARVLWNAVDVASGRFAALGRLQYLGPDTLASAEDALREQVEDVTGQVSVIYYGDGEYRPDETEEAIQQLRLRAAQLRDACVRAVGIYRSGPRELSKQPRPAQ